MNVKANIKKAIISNRVIYNVISKIYKSIRDIPILISYYNRNHHKKIQKLKNIHIDKRCFIIGNGPSLEAEDLNKLKNEYTFASNRIFNIFEKTDWRPIYYLVQDIQLLDAMGDRIEKIKAKTKFLPYNSKWYCKVHFNDCLFFYLNTENYFPKVPKFSKDASKEIFQGFTVTYAAIQLAVYMGFKEIYLIGVDFNYSTIINSKDEIINNDGVKDYFTNDTNENLNLPNLEYSYLAYKAAKQFCDEHEIEVYNATRGGKLDVFNRINFDDLFAVDNT